MNPNMIPDIPIQVIEPTPLKDFDLVMETTNPVNQITFLWTIRSIKNVALRQKLKQIRSSGFSLVPGQPQDWDVTIDFLENNMFKMRLACRSELVSPIHVASIASLYKERFRLGLKSYKRRYIFNGNDENVILQTSHRIIIQDSEEDELRLMCWFEVNGYELDSSVNFYKDDVDHEEQLENDYLSIFESKELADVKIKVEDSEFLAHKCVLKHLAPEFFKKEETEILDGELTLLDVKPRKFEKYLADIYNGNFETIVQRENMNTTDDDSTDSGDGVNVGDGALGGDLTDSENGMDSGDTADIKDTTDSEESMQCG